MNSFFDTLFGRDRKSATHAKERLRMVLIHDRIDLPPALMDNMKDELIEVISRYVEIDVRAVNIAMQQEGREQRLVADIPLMPVRRRK